MSQKQFDKKLYDKLHEFTPDYDANEAWLGMEDKLIILDSSSLFSNFVWKMFFAGVFSLVIGLGTYSLFPFSEQSTIVDSTQEKSKTLVSKSIGNSNELEVQSSHLNPLENKDVQPSINTKALTKSTLSSKQTMPNNIINKENSSNKIAKTSDTKLFSLQKEQNKKSTKYQDIYVSNASVDLPNTNSSRHQTDLLFSPSLVVNMLTFEREPIANLGIIRNDYDNFFPASNTFFSVAFSSGILESKLSSSSSHDAYLSKRKSTESALERLAISLKLEKHLNDQLYVGTGIGLSRLAKSVHNYQLDTNSITLQDQVTSIFIESNGDSTEILGDVQATQITSLEQKLYNNHYHLQVPVFVGYRIAVTDRFSVALESGGLFALKTINKGQILSPNFISNELMNIEENGYKTWGNINAYMGVNLSYAFYKNQMLHFGINHMWDVNGIQSKDSEIIEKLNSLNISMAWKFAF